MAQQIISTTDVKGYLGEIFEKEKIHTENVFLFLKIIPILTSLSVQGTIN